MSTENEKPLKQKSPEKRKKRLEQKKTLEITDITVHDRLGAYDDLFMVTVHEAIGFHCPDFEDAGDFRDDLEELVENCPRCNKQENGAGALVIEIDEKPYNICRTHFSYYLGDWPFAEYVMYKFNEVDPFYKRKFRAHGQASIEHKQVLVMSTLPEFKKDESSGSVWRYFNDNVVKALGGRWIPSQNGWLFHEDKEWVDGKWRALNCWQ